MSQSQKHHQQPIPLAKADTLPVNQDGSPLLKKLKLDFANTVVVDQDGHEVIDDNTLDDQPSQQDMGKKWQLVYDKIHFTQNNGITGQVYKLGLNDLDDMCVQWVKKYGRFYLHVGTFKFSMGRNAPETIASDNYMTKKGVALLDQDNYEALHQLFPILLQERTYLEELLFKRAK